MEVTEIKEKLQMIEPQTLNISNLRISNQGDVILSGKIKTDELQMILDDSQINLVREDNFEVSQFDFTNKLLEI